jgi:large subunit ribosomal protein L23
MIIKYPRATEKGIRMIDAENKLVFTVDRKANKAAIKKEIEEFFDVKVEKVNTLIGPDGEKRAYVRLSPDTPAIDLATQLGLM